MLMDYNDKGKIKIDMSIDKIIDEFDQDLNKLTNTPYNKKLIKVDNKSTR